MTTPEFAEEHPQSNDTVEPRLAASSGQAQDSPFEFFDETVDVATPPASISVDPPGTGDPGFVTRAFEELTLAELVGQFVRTPLATFRAVKQIATMPRESPASETGDSVRTVLISPPVPHAVPLDFARLGLQLSLHFVAFGLAVSGCHLFVAEGARSAEARLTAGAPFVILAVAVWLLSEIYVDWSAICSWWRERGRRTGDDEASTARYSPKLDDDTEPYRIVLKPTVPETLASIHPLRVVASLGTLALASMAWFGTEGNRFRWWGFWGWVLSIVCVVVATAPLSWNPTHLWRRVRGWGGNSQLRGSWTLAALLLIMGLGAFFRLHDLDGMPPQMTSDHKEKLLDAQRVLEGDYQVFFPNNGGREGMQMYAMALFSRLPGLGINHYSLKLLAVVESLVTLPVLWWMGREVFGEGDRRLGNTVGLILMALVAVSYWHVAITRVALRIILTPLFAALLVIFLSRAMRYNRRGDFVWAGLVLGFSLYAYQAARLLPLVVLAGIGLAMLRHFRRRWILARYVFHLSVLVVVAFVVFVPLFRFSVDFPELFWMRANERIFETSVTDVSFAERVEAFADHAAVLLDNIRRAFLMYNWQGDEAWFHGIPHHPAMDIYTGGLLIVGVGAWLALTIRRRDPVYVLIPLMVFIMLLPSALSIARPSENPSATRTSGSLPAAYLIAAFPLAIAGLKIRRALAEGTTLNLPLPFGTGKTEFLAALATVKARVRAFSPIFMVVSLAYLQNAHLYFDDYREKYRDSTWPYSEPGAILRGFATSEGGYGNAFMISYSYWWDYTIVGMEAGILDWPNGIDTGVTTVEDFLRDAFYCAGRDYPVDPNRDLLFFSHYLDDESEAQLREWFPDGRAMLYESYKESFDFKIYRVPALGVEGLLAFIQEYTDEPTCTPREF